MQIDASSRGSGGARARPEAGEADFTLARAVGDRDRLFDEVFRRAFTTDRNPPPMMPVFGTPTARLAAALGRLLTSQGDVFTAVLTGQLDDRVAVDDFRAADVALSTTGFTGYDRAWTKYQKSSFIFGAAVVGRALSEPPPISTADATHHLRRLADVISVRRPGA